MHRGEPIKSSLRHIVYFPESKQNYPTIVALHGRGTDAYDLMPLVESLGLDMLVVAPTAPRLFEVGGGYAWYDFGEEGIPDPPSFRESLRLLQEFLIQIRKGYPIGTSGPMLLGFSQGAVMSYAAGLLDPKNIRGVVALSGYIPTRSNLEIKWDEVHDLPVFICHGTYDELIPIGLAKESAELLRKAGARVTFREYAMGHQVSGDTVLELTSWIRDIVR